MKKFKNILALIAIYGITSVGVIHATEVNSNRDLSIILSHAAAELNAKTPMLIDEETRLDYAATTRNLFIYNNTMVNYDAEQLDPVQFTINLQEAVIAPLCDNPALKIFAELKVTLIYRYMGKDGAFITEISKDMGTCK